MSAPTFNPQALARPELLDLVPYQSARRIGGNGDIWINANESPFNNSKLDGLNRYPECQPQELIDAYSAYSQVAARNIVTSRGADEAIELLIRTFCIPGKDSIAIFGPTYGMYKISASTFNVATTEVELTSDFQLPNNWQQQVGAPKLVFICNPNNPTGSIINIDDIEATVASYPDAIVVVDEAYIEFCPQQSAARLLAKYPNLVVLRTLSKAFALAGARCGFMLASEAIIELVMRVIAPYPVPLPVAKAATNALSPTGIATMQDQVRQLNEQGAALTEFLHTIASDVISPNGNFVLARFDNVEQIKQKLTQAGIVARAYGDPRLKDAIRFSFANEAQTQAIIRALS
ncbi:histidinol-phosphate transaminase [Shewanella maritima]|uniref:Histidinol-phosphate aminotransferase n=1 Tax=Shewanella maritima TaxID=2520507 RepID=A0A411PLV7_9GAMM|nr:histidinol-phosphate transaminase [Shewanella maritima]QBF84495.1 histidinol-phosphate transaminase [Shewanella maritima]